MSNSISRSFKDISLSFVRNPITNDLTILKNEDAIKKSVSNLVRTGIGERFFNPALGTDVNKTLFELVNQNSYIFLETQIESLIKVYEPRVILQEVAVDIPPDSNDLYIKVQYLIVGLPRPSQTIEVILQPARV
jgi:phage baseplate assembly protein W